MLSALPLTGNISFLTPEAAAAEEGYYSYGIVDEKATITGVNSAISGNITIPSTLGGYPVTSIGSFAFRGRTGLTSVTIPDSVTSIGFDAFDGCTGLTSVTIPDSVTSIDSHAFKNTAYYQNENNWVNGLLYINNHLLEAKKDISGAVNIKNGTKTIVEYAFSGCTGLTSVTIPDSVTSIGYRAFEDCTGLTSITIPDSGTSIGHSAFENTAYYQNDNNWANGLLYINNYLIEAKKDISGVVNIKNGTKTIVEYAFSGCTGLTSVTIPDSVTSIERGTFQDCAGLTSVTIPDSVTSIGSSAFRGCTRLASVTIPDSVTSIGSYAFSGCTGLTSVTIPDSVTSIGSAAFYGCTGLTTVTIPDSVTSIGYYAFRVCTGLTSVTIPDSVTSIGYRAFEDCTRLTSITIPNSVTSIEGGTFRGCTGLTSVTIPASVTSIGWAAFEDCNKLTAVEIPKNVTELNYCAFASCSSLKSINLPEGLKFIDEAVFDGCSINEVTVPRSVSYIGDNAFNNSLTKITLVNPATTLSPSFVGVNTEIHGYENSTAEKYAKEYGNKFVLITTNLIEFEDYTNMKLRNNNIFAVPGIKTAELLSKIEGTVSITDKDGKAVSSDAPIASGMTVTLRDKDGKVLETKIVIVPCDNDGDGTVSSSDARTALRAAVCLDKLSDWQITASDVQELNIKKEITSADARHILRAAVGLESVKDWMKNIK